jgi:UDP-glucose 4-epimerase
MMISPEEAKRAVRRGDYYFIKPMLPELRSAWTDDEQVIEGALYSSDYLLTMEATRSLLSGNGFIEAPAHPAVRVVAS